MCNDGETLRFTTTSRLQKLRCLALQTVRIGIAVALAICKNHTLHVILSYLALHVNLLSI